jgi:hypothetical protein
MKLIFAAAFVALLWPAHAIAQSQQLSSCLSQEDMTKERLNCYDAVISPQIRQVLQLEPARTVSDCRYIKEEDQRLKCFNRFVAGAAQPAAKRLAKPKL